MMNAPQSKRKYIISIVISVLALSALGCNLASRVLQGQPYEPRLREEEPYFDKGEHGEEGEPWHGEEGEPWHGEEQHHEEDPFHKEGEPHGEEGSFHEEGEPHHDEGSHHEEGEPHHEEGSHREEGEPQHGEEPHQEEECPPESECPGGPGGEPGGESDVRADLAVTDVFPENLPHGDLKVRITNNGPTPLTTYPAELFCHAHGVSWGGPEHGEEDREGHQQIILSLGPGDTDEFETGIKIDANLYQYEVFCEVWVEIDHEHSNNFYMEMVPQSNP